MTSIEITANVERAPLREINAVITNVIRNFKAENYESLIKAFPTYNFMGCEMSLK